MRAILAAAVLGVALAVSALAGPALAQTNPLEAPIPAAISLIQEGRAYVFRDEESRTLYFYDRDTPGRSNCEGQCATNWPPVVAAADARQVGEWTPVQRSDGARQWAYRGKPVYRFSHDTEPGQTNGASVPGWHIAAP